MKRTDRRSDCPTNFAVQAIGDSWSLLIVRDLMFKGKTTFSEFAESEERISTNILAARLTSLAKAGIIVKQGSGKETRYSLTEKGLDLLPLMVEMIIWSGRHDPNTAAPDDFLSRAAEDRAGLLAEIESRLRESNAVQPVA